MRRFTAFSSVFLLSALISAAGPLPLCRTVAAVKEAKNAAAYKTPFDVEATVIFFVHPDNGPVTVVDDTGTMEYYNYTPVTPAHLKIGDRLRLKGRIRKHSYRNKLNEQRTYALISCTNAEILAHGPPPDPLAVTARALARGEVPDNRLIRAEGRVVDACVDDIHANWATLMLEDGDERFYVFATRPADETFDFSDLIGARVSLLGLHYRNLNTGSIRQAAIHSAVCVNSRDAFTVLTPAVHPKARDIRELDVSQRNFSANLQEQRQTYCATGHVIAVWGKDKILLRTKDNLVVRGELAEQPAPAYGEKILLTGLPETDLFKPILVRARWQPVDAPGIPPEPAAKPRYGEMQTTDFGADQFNFRYYGNPVRLRGIVRGLPVPGGDGVLYLEDRGQIVPVDVSSVPGATDGLGIGFEIEVTGTCVMDTEKMTLNCVFPRINGFRIVARVRDDIRILRRPPWWTPAKLFVLIGVLLAVLVGVAIWNRLLQRLVDRRGKDLFDEQVAHYGADLRIEERTRLAVELHDSLSQTLTGVAMEVEAAQQFAGGAAPELAQHLGVAQRTLKSCRNELRNCLWDLRNQSLEETDMNTAIRRTLLPHVRGVATGIRFNLPRERFSDNTIHAILRIIRELSVNAIKHGRATALQVAGGIEGDRLLFSVTNNGTPFDPDTAPGVTQGHFGLEGIRERLRTFDGTLEVSTTADGRVRVKVTMRIPHPDIEEEKT